MLGNIISAGANIIGGLLNRKSQKDSLKAQQAMADQNIQLQKDFAQQGIRWKVEDAKAAGIHPLYALGANTHSFSPVGIGTTGGGDSLGSSIAAAGQDIGRAINVARTKKEREQAQSQAAQLAGLKARTCWFAE